MEMNITQWSIIPEDKFLSMEFDSGLLVKNFDPDNFSTPSASDILCTTTGNITHTYNPQRVNLATDVNNIHIEPKELEVMTGYEKPTIGFTALNATPAFLKFLAGHADIDDQNANHIVPRMNVKQADFEGIALIMMLVGGGFAAVSLSNALSTGGISLTTQKGGKGTMQVTISGYGSISNQSKIPVDYYSTADNSSTLASITVASAAGTTSGTTKLTLTYTPGTGESYVYKIGQTSAPAIGYYEKPDYTWTAWNGSADITATNGYKIAVASINGDGRAVAYGSATVVANAGA